MTIINKLEEHFSQKSLASLDYRINRDFITFCSETDLDKEDVSILIDTDGNSNKSYPSVKTMIFINTHLNVSKEELDFFCFKINIDIDLFCQQTGLINEGVIISFDTIHNFKKSNRKRTEKNNTTDKDNQDEESIENRACLFKSQVPNPGIDFDSLILPPEIKENLKFILDSTEVSEFVYGQWNLAKIKPFRSIILNFYGKPGTGKTYCSKAIANYLKKKILVVSCADIESKFYGEGAKYLKAAFYAAKRDGSVLVFEEADPLVGKRENSEQAARSICSQFLICLEEHEGLVILTTNLAEDYDNAIESRVRNINFPMPDENCRRQIWQQHLPEQLPLASDVSINELAKADNVCGRDIREAVLDAANRVAVQANRDGLDLAKLKVTNKDFFEAIERKITQRISRESDQLPPEEEKQLSQKIMCHSASSGWTLTNINLGRITQENQDECFGHTFTVRFNLNYQPQRKFVDIVPMLEWNEVIYIFERDVNNNWVQISEENTNQYQEAPKSITFNLWRSIYEGNETTKDVFAREGGELEGFILDKPSIRKIDKETNQYRTSRRVVHFDIGLKGFAQRVQAAEILEIVEGEITIYQFINQRIEYVRENDPRLEQWRTQYQNGLPI
ncbi:putative AAA family ATPase [Calothrix parasitica NIES-267]|uniref:Putative AAA family ATPase n=1 Tax=Calothrix parasitica NIES-267 TaxID=1973488 RepID=A0A1Z4LTV8_9CYAN|nr:putative AAA family ATPase [Calothrix parasitica NIES-267]